MNADSHDATGMKSNPVGEFELQIAILPEDIDEQGHVNNVVYVRWIQEVATAHWRTAAPAPDQAKLGWVVVRHEIDYKRQAFLHDQIMDRDGSTPGVRSSHGNPPCFRPQGSGGLPHRLVSDRSRNGKADGCQRRRAGTVLRSHAGKGAWQDVVPG
jgi:hypothetical protein